MRQEAVAGGDGGDGGGGGGGGWGGALHDLGPQLLGMGTCQPCPLPATVSVHMMSPCHAPPLAVEEAEGRGGQGHRPAWHTGAWGEGSQG